MPLVGCATGSCSDLGKKKKAFTDSGFPHSSPYYEDTIAVYLQLTLLSQASEGLNRKHQLQINLTYWLPWFHV